MIVNYQLMPFGIISLYAIIKPKIPGGGEMASRFRKIVNRTMIEVKKGEEKFENLQLIHRWCFGGEIQKFKENDVIYLKCEKCGEYLGMITPEHADEFVKTSKDRRERQLWVDDNFYLTII